MRTNIIAIVCTIALSIAGCGTGISPVTSKRSTIKNYRLQENRTIGIGEQIFEVQNAAMRRAFRVTADYIPPQYDAWNGGLDYPPMSRGMLFGVVGTMSDSSLIVGNSTFTAANPLIRTPIQVDLRITASGIVIGQFQRVGTTGWAKLGGSAWSADPIFEPSVESAIEGGSFKAEMIFTGISGSTIKAVYREYVNDYARPVFTTELQYNLDESKTMAYKSIKMNVIKATNSALEFVVVSDDDLPWVK
jgi:hypothetical protein